MILNMQPKILILDLETKPATAYVWRLFKENVGLEQLEDPGGVICVGLKWLGERETFFFSEWEHGHRGMSLGVHSMLSEADAVVTYNGDKFDLPKLTSCFLQHDLKLPPPLTSIDLYKTVRNKLGLISNRLQFVAEFLGVGQKVKHEGFSLWKKVMAGDPAAQRKMQRYCLGDVRLTERVYKKLRPYIINHPHLGLVGRTGCGACGSDHTQSRGYRRTKSFLIQRIQCQTCGSWQDGARKKVA
jgi:hypothetical protein